MTPLSRDSAADIGISCAFEENAIRAISRRAHEQNRLTVRSLRDTSGILRTAASVSKMLGRPEKLESYVTKQLAKATKHALPEDKPSSALSELVRVAGGRYRSPLTHTWGNATWKVLHDRVARRVDFGGASTLIGMPGSSLHTFEANTSRRLVLHEIDAHPRTRNDRLEHFYGARHARAEMYPRRFVERIEAEMELADNILVPGRVVASQMHEHGIAESKVITVPYGVDPTVFRPGDSDRRGPGNGRLQAVFTGQVCLRKGVPFLLEAVRNQPIDLTIVGQIFDKRIVKNLPSNVTLAGILSPGELADLYARMDVFVLPSIEDNFALVVAEAAGAGLPVITTKETGSHELLSENHTVLDAGHVQTLRDALASHAQLTWQRRQEIANETSSSAFTSWEIYADRVIEAITA